MEKTIYDLKVYFEEPLLGSQTSREVTSEYVHSKATPDDEIAALTPAEELEKRTNVFHKDEKDGSPIIFDYQFKGFFKEAAAAVKQHGNIKQVKSKIETYLFVAPRRIKVLIPGPTDFKENPLRAMTAQGPRVTLSRKEAAHAEVKPEGQEGAKLELHLLTLGSVVPESLIRELLAYGKWCGAGQWRSGGFGRFDYDLLLSDISYDDFMKKIGRPNRNK